MKFGKLTIFDCLKDIIVDKSGNLIDCPDFKTIWSNYMIVRYLSMDCRFMEYAEVMNNYQGLLSQEQMYKMLLVTIPKHSSSYIKYISKPKKSKKSADSAEQLDGDQD